MKSSVESLSNLQKKLVIEVPIEAVRDSFNKAYAGMQKKAAIKGFRKGKAPMSMIKSMYKEKVTPDVLNNLINEGYFAAISEHKLRPLEMPEINVDAFGEEQGLRFSATVELRPEIELKKYEGLEVKKEKFEVKEEQLNTVLADLQKHHSDLVPVLEDRPAQKGDISVIDFKGFIGTGDAASPLPGGEGTDHNLELGSDQFIPGFEDGVIGMKVGSDKDLHLTFPSEYHAKELAGKTVHFKVTKKKKKKKVAPTLDDEFAKKVGDHESLEVLKDAIRKDIQNGEETRIKNELKDRLLKALVKANPVEVPVSLKEKQKQRLVEDLQQRMQKEGLGPDQFEEYKKSACKGKSTPIDFAELIDAVGRKDKEKILQDAKEKAFFDKMFASGKGASSSEFLPEGSRQVLDDQGLI